MTKEGVFALGFFLGTPTAKGCVPMAREEKIPVVGLFTGAQMLYAPLKRYVINMRASYYDETREQVDKLWDVNVRKMAVIYQGDAFGKAVLDRVKLALAKHKSQVSVEVLSGLSAELGEPGGVRGRDGRGRGMESRRKGCNPRKIHYRH